MPVINWLKYRSVIGYGLLLAALLFFLKWLEWRFVIVNYSLEIYVGLTAILYTALGIWLALKLITPKTNTVYVEAESYPIEAFVQYEFELQKSGISNRELDVLQLMAQGLSNQQIAERLFVSLNTVKTHSSKLFEKLQVQRRTQAIEKAKRLNLIP
ncbi:response regulator transcription factor [Mucilaginibacter glaciei]|uniref:Response regulator transcription factor n=1 Tax=Mucilaginibacter glaciei TaxID=2772109 RepID=A0A926NQE3_9SPHI|nr:response regulator transcription factor [Mucilaginibacter glaciei]MBD1391965.1 response regulator transcription factor [Mucilaginibacter glaciei]